MGGWQLLVDKDIWLLHKVGVGCLDGLVLLFFLVQFPINVQLQWVDHAVAMTMSTARSPRRKRPTKEAAGA